LALSSFKHHAMNMFGRVEVYLQAFLALALDISEWSASRFGHFASWGRVPSVHWIRGCMGRSIGLDSVEKRRSLPLPGIKHRFPGYQLVQPVCNHSNDRIVSPLMRKAYKKLVWKTDWKGQFWKSGNEGTLSKIVVVWVMTPCSLVDRNS
jgi:hypothetical protein